MTEFTHSILVLKKFPHPKIINLKVSVFLTYLFRPEYKFLPAASLIHFILGFSFLNKLICDQDTTEHY